MPNRAVALSIAGSDSSGAAGVQADLKTFHQLGVYGTCALTLVSAQDAESVRALEPLPPALVEAQIAAVDRDFQIGAAKTGALGGADQLRAVLCALRAIDSVPLVVDPVLYATTGTALFEDEALDLMRRELFPAATLLTPNLPEAARILGVDVAELGSPDAKREAIESLAALGPHAVLLKDGHASGAVCEDWLYDGEVLHSFRAPRLPTKHTRGTGCTYSAAITAHLACGLSLLEAVESAHEFVQRALSGAPGATPRSGGRGPLDHWGPSS